MTRPGPSASDSRPHAVGRDLAGAGLAVTYEGGDPAFLACVLDRVEFLELSPDSLASVERGRLRIPERTLSELADLAREVEFIVHGIGLSIGTAGGVNDQYFELVDQLVDRVDVRWHSEHLGLTTVDGEFLGTMLPLPRTEECLDMLCTRVTAIQERYRLPFLLENVVSMIPDAPGEYSEAQFLGELVRRTGCGILLDVYNLQCDEHNHGFDITVFLDELDLAAVGELHLAGGLVEHGMCLDVHSRPAQPSTFDLVAEVLARTPNVAAVTYEFLGEAVRVLGAPVIADELLRLRGAVDRR